MLGLIVGVGLFCFVLLYFSNSLSKDHMLLKVLAYFFIIAAVILMGKAMLDSGQTCENVLDYEIQNLTSENITQTNYYYDTYCYDNTDENTGVYTYRLFLGFALMFFIYVFIYFSWRVLKWAGTTYRKR